MDNENFSDTFLQDCEIITLHVRIRELEFENQELRNTITHHQQLLRKVYRALNKKQQHYRSTTAGYAQTPSSG